MVLLKKKNIIMNNAWLISIYNLKHLWKIVISLSQIKGIVLVISIDSWWKEEDIRLTVLPFYFKKVFNSKN